LIHAFFSLWTYPQSLLSSISSFTVVDDVSL